MDRQTGQADTQTEGQISRQWEGQMDRQADRQKDMQTDRKTDKKNFALKNLIMSASFFYNTRFQKDEC